MSETGLTTLPSSITIHADDTIVPHYISGTHSGARAGKEQGGLSHGAQNTSGSLLTRGNILPQRLC